MWCLYIRDDACASDWLPIGWFASRKQARNQRALFKHAIGGSYKVEKVNV